MVIFGAVNVEVQAGVVKFAKGDRARVGSEELFEGRYRGACDSPEHGFGEQDGMAWMPMPRGLAGPDGVFGAEVEQVLESPAFQVRLVAEDDRPVRQIGSPSGKSGGALDGTEHALVGSRVDDPVFGREPKAVEFRVDGLASGRANHRDLLRSQRLPLPSQVSEN